MMFRRKAREKADYRKLSGVFGKGAVPLAFLRPGQRGVIASIRLQDSADLHRLKSLGLIPGALVVMERVWPVLALRLPYSHLFMDDELAQKIFIFPESTIK